MYEELLKEFKTFREQVYAKFAEYDEILRTFIGSNSEKIVSTFTDENAVKVTDLFPEWKECLSVSVGDRYQYNGKLYKCVQAHTTQADWTPENSPSLYAKILPGQSGTQIGEWVQPDSTNPYMKGDKVTHGGKVWVSSVDNNVWEPGVYGWEEIA